MKRLRVAVLIALVLSLAFPVPAQADPGSEPKDPSKVTLKWVKNGKPLGGITTGALAVCNGHSDNPHRSTHPATYGNITAESRTTCSQTMASITANGRLYKEFAWAFWVQIAYDPKTLFGNSFVQTNPGVPCPGSLNYKIETYHEATTYDGAYGSGGTVKTLFVSC